MNVQASESMREAWTALEGRVINGVFPLHRHLGGSEHAGVFLSTDAKRKLAEVAIKLVPATPPHAEAQLSRWLTAADLTHPHLIRIFEAGRCQFGGVNYLYALMDYADQNLAQLLAHRALTVDETREMLVPALSALTFLHQKSFVQGQLKPANILVVGDQIKLASDAIHPVSEATGRSNVTSVYDPPVALDGSCATTGDLWALGVALSEALTRRRPVGLHELRGNPILPPDLPPGFREVVARCLSRRASDRPTAADLQAWLDGEPLQPAPAAASSAPAPASAAPASTREPVATRPSVERPPAPPMAAPEVGAPRTSGQRPEAAAPAIVVQQFEAGRILTPQPETNARRSSTPQLETNARRNSTPQPQTVGSRNPAQQPETQVRHSPAPQPDTGARRSPAQQPETDVRRSAQQPETEVRRSPTPQPDTAARRSSAQQPETDPRLSPAQQPETYAQRSAAQQPERDRPASDRQLPRWRALPLFLVAVVMFVLGWAGLRLLNSEPVPTPPAVDTGQVAEPEPLPALPPPSEEAPVVAESPPPAPQASTPSTEPEDASNAWAVHEELPEVPQRASQTIRGTVKVSVRLIVDKDGTVFAALTDEAGPSRYFERLAIEAAKKWTFEPVGTDVQRFVIVRFEFTREGATARAVPAG